MCLFLQSIQSSDRISMTAYFPPLAKHRTTNLVVKSVEEICTSFYSSHKFCISIMKNPKQQNMGGLPSAQTLRLLKDLVK